MKEFLRRFTIIHSDDLIVDSWADVRFQRRVQPISVADCWIAATALAYQLELVTHKTPRTSPGSPASPSFRNSFESTSCALQG